MLSEREGSLCRSALQRCPHCQKYWPTEESLDAHLRNDSKCKRAENIPFTISFLQTNGEQPTSVADKRHSTRDISHAINVTHHGITEQRNIQRMSKLCEKKLSSEPSPSNIAMAKRLNDFRLAVKNQSTRVSINVNELLVDGALSPIEKLVGHILLQTRFCDKTGVLELHESFKELRIAFRNTTATLSLNGDLSLLPGAEAVMKDVEDVELEKFVMIHGTVILPDDFDATSSQNTDQTVAKGHHGSMVFGLQINDTSIQDDNSNDFDGMTNNSSDMEDSLHSMPLLCNNDVVDVEIVDSTMIEMHDEIVTARVTGVLGDADIASIRLFNLLDKASAPKNLYDLILKWVKENKSELEHIECFQNRKTFLKNVSVKALGRRFSKVSGPTKTDLLLLSQRIIPVTTFSLRTAIVSLLTDHNLMRESNLLIDPERRFGCAEKDDYLDDINSGWWEKGKPGGKTGGMRNLFKSSGARTCLI